MTELFVMAVWVIHLLPKMAAHIAFRAQTFRIRPFMRQTRAALLPAALIAILSTGGFAPLAQAHSVSSSRPAGSAAPERAVIAVANGEISLDEAVSRAERQYRARVVRTDVQDEDGRKVYVLKLLSEDGRVFTVRIDAQSGRSR
jgi:hypothetical protein